MKLDDEATKILEALTDRPHLVDENPLVVLDALQRSGMKLPGLPNSRRRTNAVIRALDAAHEITRQVKLMAKEDRGQ